MRFYQRLNNKIFLLEKHIKERKEKEQLSPLFFALAPNQKPYRNFSFLDSWEHLELSFYKFLLVLAQIYLVIKGAPASNFNVFTQAGRDGIYICNYSYCRYKGFHKNIKWKFITMVTAATIMVSLAVALIFPGKPVTKAATISWLQSSWAGGASAGYPNHASQIINGTVWTEYASSPAKGANVSAGSGGVTLLPTPGVYTETSDGDFGAGTQGNTYVSSGSVKLILPPGAPTWNATPFVVSSSQLTVQWIAPADNGGGALTGYRVQRSPDNSTFTEISSGACANSSLNGSSISCIDTGLTNGSTYYYKILATNAIGDGTLSSVSSQTLDWVYSGVCSGITVYYQNIGTDYNWKTISSDCVSPQCSLTGTYPDDLVADNNISFTSYPARDACKTVGGRLPTISELDCIYTNRAALGNNFSTTYVWSSTEDSASNANYKLFSNGGLGSTAKSGSSSNISVRCVR